MREKKAIVLSLVMAIVFGMFVGNTQVYAASGDTVVYLTKTGECYHAAGCTSLRRSKIETTLQDAVNRGYRACSNCHPGSLDAASPAPSAPAPAAQAAVNTAPAVANAQSTTAAATAVAVDPTVEELKTYKGNTKDFNAYTYYMNYADLRTAIGANGDALKKHYTSSGKSEGRVANSLLTKATQATASAATTDPAVEALKTYKGNTKDFNAYAYYMNNADLRTAIGANGDALLKHYNDYGKAEKRVAK